MELIQVLLVGLALASVTSAIDYSICRDCPPAKQPYLAYEQPRACSVGEKYETFNRKGWCCRSERPLRYCEGFCKDSGAYYRVFNETEIKHEYDYDGYVYPVLDTTGESMCTVAKKTFTYERFYCSNKKHECKVYYYWVLSPKHCVCSGCKSCPNSGGF